MSNAPAPDRTVPSGDAQLEVLTSLADVRSAATRVARSAQRLLTLHTHDLEPAVLEHPPFLDAVKRLVLGPRYAKVRVLVLAPARVRYDNSAFIALARKLTSYVEIRHAEASHRQDSASYLVADDEAFLCRLQESRWEGVCHLHAPLSARSFLDRFDAAWIDSAPERARPQPTAA